MTLSLSECMTLLLQKTNQSSWEGGGGMAGPELSKIFKFSARKTQINQHAHNKY